MMLTQLKLNLKQSNKIAIISDLHLSDKFNQKTDELVNQLINEADVLIINGDFSDQLFTSLAKWKKTWQKSQLLNKTILVRGNHDFASLTPIKQILLKTKRRTYVISHGSKHNAYPLIIGKCTSKIDSLATRIFGRRWPKYFYWWFSNQQKQAKLPKHNAWRIVGHTHRAEIDPKRKYVNTGQFKDGVYDVTWITNEGLWQTERR